MQLKLADSATEDDEVTDAEETTQLVDTEAGESAEDGDDAVDVESVAESVDTSSGDVKNKVVKKKAVKKKAVKKKDVKKKDVQKPKAKRVEPQPRRRHRINWSRVTAFGVLPVLAVLAAGAAGFFHWQNVWNRGSGVAGIESVAAAKDSTIAILSYQPETVEKDLAAGSDRLTGKFKESYTQLIHDVVIPGAKKARISAIATVPAAASVSATPKHAVALIYVNQTVTVGNDVPADSASAVRVTMEKSGNRWLISAFDPI